MKFFVKPTTLMLASLLFHRGIVLADEHEHQHPSKPLEHDEHREHATHVHGEGQLTLAIDGNSVAITLESPAESIIGFEHAPHTEQEKAQLSAALATLNAPASLFIFTADANCKSVSHHVESPFSDHHPHNASSHADLDAEYNFECEHPEKINKVTLPLLTLFSSLRTLKVDYVTEKTQGSQTLSTTHTELTLR